LARAVCVACRQMMLSANWTVASWRPRGTACAGSSASGAGCAAGSQPCQPLVAARHQHRCGHGWPAGRHARGWCAGDGGTQCRPVGVACVGRVASQVPHPLTGAPRRRVAGTASTRTISCQVSASWPGCAGWPGCGHDHRRGCAAWWSARHVTAPTLAGVVPGSAYSLVPGAGGVLVARTMVASICASQSSSPAASAWARKAASIGVQVSEVCQRANRSSTVWQGPSRSGRPRQGMRCAPETRCR
jgi:hypothetical protein